MSFFFQLSMMHFIVAFIMLLLSFIFSNKHILINLMILEGLVLVLLFLIYNMSIYSINYSGYLLSMMTIAACEGALGLSILVYLVRCYSSDHFNSMNMLQC